MAFFSLIWHKIRPAGIIFLGLLLLGSSSMPPGGQTERVRVFTRDVEFDYVGWTLDALRIKLDQFSLGMGGYLTHDTRHQTVLDYLSLVADVQQANAQLEAIYSDPRITDPFTTSRSLRKQLDDLRQRQDQLEPVVESVLQSQVAQVVGELGLTLGGQPIPPVLFHSSSLPWALIISPRNVIRQDDDISLVPPLSLDQRVALENRVDQTLDVSSLVVGIGGVGVYPTMVQRTPDLDWLSEVVSHEWVHNFLTLRPLGLSYLSSPALRIMNETTASIAGKEIGRKLLEKYYPELLQPPLTPAASSGSKSNSKGAINASPAAPLFNFQSEMRVTRVTVDQMLGEGKIDEAEAYMNQRRLFFWDHHYPIRKLNQAYFAFYGAYADQPGGAAGEDPVGAAVRALRAQSASLADFLNRISWMSSFEQLKKAVQEQ